MKHRLYRFSSTNGGREIVVISDLPPQEVMAKYTDDGHVSDGVLDIQGDATPFPCDRELYYNVY